MNYFKNTHYKARLFRLAGLLGFYPRFWLKTFAPSHCRRLKVSDSLAWRLLPKRGMPSISVWAWEGVLLPSPYIKELFFHKLIGGFARCFFHSSLAVL